MGGYILSLEGVKGTDGGRNRYVRAAGGSEGYGVGAAVGLKFAVPDKPVVALIGDGIAVVRGLRGFGRRHIMGCPYFTL